MKFRGIPLISIALVVICVANFIVHRLFSSAYSYYGPFMDGMLAGVLLLYALYFINIYVVAWQNNQKNHIQQ